MKVLLTDDVVGLGDIGETVTVRPGYARNFLIPNGLAIEAGADNARIVAHKMKQVEAKKKKLKTEAEQKAAHLREVQVEVFLRVGSGGKVFGSIHAKEIAEKLTELGHSIDRRRIVLDEPLRKIGSHTVSARLHADVETPIQVTVSPLAATKEEEEREAEEARRSFEDKVARKKEQTAEEE
jgi:large subunit ribosomal protein L9